MKDLAVVPFGVNSWMIILADVTKLVFPGGKKSKTFVHSYGTIIEPPATKPISFVGNSKALLEFDPLLCLE